MEQGNSLASPYLDHKFFDIFKEDWPIISWLLNCKHGWSREVKCFLVHYGKV